MSDNSHDQEPKTLFQSFGSILDGMQGQLFDGFEIVPDEVAPEPKKSRQPKEELAKAAAEIKGRSSYAERYYMARELVQCTLPLRDPKGATVWARKNGNFTLILQSGIDPETLQPRGLPYGEWARLLLLWIITEAKRTQSRHLKLSRSFTGFVRLVGGDPDKGGGDAKRLKEQLLRLLDCNIDFRYIGSNGQDESIGKKPMPVAPEYRLWWSSKNPDQDALFESDLIIGERFFESIMNNPVHVDWRIVTALKNKLKQSAFAIDVYIWASWRIYKMREKGIKQVVIPFDSLEMQFGAEFGRTRDFKQKFVLKLDEVQLFFPALGYKFEKGNFHLIDAGDAALLPAQKAAKKQLKQLQPHNEISHRTRSRFVRAYPDHKVEKALAAFHTWREKRGIEAGNINALFWTFAETWTTNNPP